MKNSTIQLIECPRDAMQGIHEFIPTEKKAEYINLLLKAGFDTIDFGSFVSPQAIPQLRDTAEVLSKLDLKNTKSKLLAIVANARGAEDAVKYSEITYLGFPFSVSETFQKRNTNSTIEKSLDTVERIQSLCINSGKKLVIYISMGFGNPYGDTWNQDVVYKWVKRITELGIDIVSIADTVGVSNPENIKLIFGQLIPEFPNVVVGAHLHSNPVSWKEKIVAAFDSGCLRFDSAVKGYGGCPMAEDKLVGNIATENIISFLDERKVTLNIHRDELNNAILMSSSVFPS